MKPEEQARNQIDTLLVQAGWIIQNMDEANILAGRGVTIREFPLKSGFGFADYLLFLVDRGNLGKQTLKEFQQYVSPYNNFKFHEEYIVQRLTSNTLVTTARVCICTIQRLYSMLKGRELTEEDEEYSVSGMDSLFKEVDPLEYNPAIPIGTFDFIITDECHRSIYNLWRQVLEYFEAFLIGLTATPSKQTFGFFNKNLVMEYDHERAVADGVNVNYDVYRIKTKITEKGSTVKAGYYLDKRDRDTHEVRWEKLDEDFEYDPGKLDRDVVAKDQIRTIVRTFKDKVIIEIFPGRDYVPKTLIFAKDDSHAEDIVTIVREEFGKGNDFAQKITYKTSGAKPEDLIASFRNSFNPRIAVTVDMIATGTDIKPLEIVMFMRAVKSRGFFEQMKGRGVRVINTNDLQAVTPDAKAKDHFIIVGCVGVCEMDKTDSRPMERKPTANFRIWLAQQEAGGRQFSEEQHKWLTMIRDHIAANVSIDTDDFDYTPFSQQGGLGKVYQLFGEDLSTVIEDLNGALAA